MLLSNLALLLAPVAIVAAPLDARQASSGSIDAKFKPLGKQYFGTIADPGTLSNTKNTAIIKADLGQLNAENSMKWDALKPNRCQLEHFSFSGADQVVNFATQNNKKLRVHTLLWHSQLPQWVKNINDRATITSVIQNSHRHRGRPLQGQDPAVGHRQRDLQRIRHHTRQHLLSCARRGLRSQAHLGVGGGANIPAAIKALAASGVKEVAITKLDIAQAEATDYVNAVKGCTQAHKCVGVTVWGVSDANSWRTNDNPLLFDRNFQVKSVYDALMKQL